MSGFWSKFTRRLRAGREAVRSDDRMLLVRIFLFASAVPLLMRMRPRTLARLLGTSMKNVEAASPERVARILRHFQLARRIGSPLVRTGCLTRGLTLYYVLRRAGVDVALCFGVARSAGEFTGHCWLSQGGAPFLEDPDPRPLYAHVFSIPFDVPPSDTIASRSLRHLTCP